MENLRWMDEAKTLIGCEVDGRPTVIPAVSENSDYNAIVVKELEIADFQS